MCLDKRDFIITFIKCSFVLFVWNVKLELKIPKYHTESQQDKQNHKVQVKTRQINSGIFSKEKHDI